MEEAIVRINELRPKFVFLSAKSGAGKTYFSNHLKGYKVLELDEVVKTDSLQDVQEALPAPVMDAFVMNVHYFFQQHPNTPIVVEGAIAEATLVKRIFSGPYAEFMFVYLYPVDVNAYASRMMKRFKLEKENGIRSLSIWPEVTPQLEEVAYESKELKQFMLRMARESMAKSLSATTTSRRMA
ncbi:P-loop containing nucleoside triphosphate hydrolase [Phytophthora cactorum]|nr:P-loop containing nucleoside triphosphate hydrolase [Phytophthora cactorum]